jgi:tRNA pseudouridine55 synthase
VKAVNNDNSPFNGVIVPINKPVGITSFGVVHHIRKATGIKKVGHAGTLDPFAQGVLVVGIGRSATRQLEVFMRQEKEYVARVVFGTVTDTDDPTGKIIEQNNFIMPEPTTLDGVISRYVGEIDQIPPRYSAIKINGVRLYKLARKGIDIERQPRKVLIKQIEVVNLTDDGFNMRVVCSHGTYIRSLAYDIGRDLGFGAHLSELTRVRIGQFTVDSSESLEQFIARATNKEYI